jgi:hypothetical protein
MVLEPPPAEALFLTLYATGVQIYSNVGGAWSAGSTPDAALFSDPARTLHFGTHFGGPTWQADPPDGSEVMATRVTGAFFPSDDPGGILQLLLIAISHTGNGIFSDVSYIQRLDTVDGTVQAAVDAGICPNAPTLPGDTCSSPYDATYRFFLHTPEPSTWLLLATGFAGLLSYSWCRRRMGQA